MADAIPTRWVTLDTSWGEGKRHLYCEDKESLEFHKTSEEAFRHASAEIEGGSKMVAILEIKTVLVARAIEYDALT